MKQDTERYLMELEEEHTWLAYELRARNAVRMRKEHEVRELTKQEAKKDKKKQLDIEMEQGLSYFRGEIINYRYAGRQAGRQAGVLCVGMGGGDFVMLGCAVAHFYFVVSLP